MAAELTIPQKGGGGPPLSIAEESDIRKWLRLKTKELHEEPNGRFAGSSRTWVAAAKAELVKRGLDVSEYDAPPPAPNGPQRSAAGNHAAPNGGARVDRVAKVPDVMTFHDAGALRAAIDDLEADYNIVGSISVGQIPIAHSVILSVVRIPETGWFKTDGGVSLKGSSIALIMNAASVSMIRSQQISRDPAGYCLYSVTASCRDLSGATRVMSTTGELDLRPGASEYETLLEAGQKRLENARRKGWDLPDPMGQIRAKRQHIAAQAESKGFLRACRKLFALDRPFTAEEARKPFLVPKIELTGHTDDPELKKIAFIGMMQSSIRGSAALFGTAQAAAPMLAPGYQPAQIGPASYVPIGDADDPYEAEAIPPPRPTPTQQGAPREPGDDVGLGDDDFPANY